jgi:Tol biopolymer transport system component
VVIATLNAVSSASPVPVGRDRREDVFGAVPLGFEANRGQSAPVVKFLSRGNGYALFLTPSEIVLALGDARSDPGSTANGVAVLRMSLLGSNPTPRLAALDALPGSVNYLRGNDPAGWRTAIPMFARVMYEQVYPGIDMVLYGNQRHLEYDFVVAPGAEPTRIGLSFAGADDLTLSSNGDLVISTAAGDVWQPRPVVYQEVEGVRHPVAARYSLDGAHIGFRLGEYEPSRPLVIDPAVEYSTFLGGLTSYDAAQGVAVDSSGAAYIGGDTFSTDFPTTSGAFESSRNETAVCAPAQDPNFAPPPEDVCRSDLFVTKLTPDGTGIVYSTFLGGAQSEWPEEIAVDATGSAYVVGGTNSADFPTTPGALDSTFAGTRRLIGVGLAVRAEAFLTKLSPDGQALVYSTYLGGSDADEAMGVKVDLSGAAYVAGHTYSADFPVTPGAFDTGLNTTDAPPGLYSDAFVVKVAPQGNALAYGTFLGGTRVEFAMDVAVDDAGSAYVTGDSTSADFPTTAGAFQTAGHLHPETANSDTPLEQFDDADAYVAKLVPDGSALTYATYLGGDRHEHGHAIEVRSGAAYVAGHTYSADFPTTTGAFDGTSDGAGSLDDAFVARIDPTGSSLVYSTFLGGSGGDWAMDVAVDAGGAAYITGMTASSDYPTTPDALDATFVGASALDPTVTKAQFFDAMLTKVSSDGASLAYSSYFGGSGPDIGTGIALGGTGSVYLAGFTFSPDMTTTLGSFDPVFRGPLTYSDAFVAKFSGLCDPCGALVPGELLLFSSDQGDPNSLPPIGFPIAPGKNIDLYSLSTAGQARLTNAIGNDQFAVWSPDGAKIAFEASRSTTISPFVNYDIYVMNADGTGVDRLTTSLAFDTTPSWSPDGQRIAFTSFRSGDPEIYVMNADGSGQHRITHAAGWDFAFGNWCPDGRILFHSDRAAAALPLEPVPLGTFDVYLMDADGSNVTPLTTDPANDDEAVCSPDGAKVVFVSERDGAREVYVMDIDGTSQTRLTFDGASASRPSWSSDGARIAFDSDADGDQEIYLMNADGTDVTQLTHNTRFDFHPVFRS